MGKKHLIQFRLVVYIFMIFLLIQSSNICKSDTYSKQKITIGNNLTVSKHYKFSHYSLSCYLDDYGVYNKMFRIFGQGQLEGMNLMFKIVSISISVDSDQAYCNSNLTIPVGVIHSGDTVQYNLSINVYSNISQKVLESRYLWTNVKVSYLITEIMKGGNISKSDSLENYRTHLLTTTSPSYLQEPI